MNAVDNFLKLVEECTAEGLDTSNEISIFEGGLLVFPKVGEEVMLTLYGIKTDDEGNYISFNCFYASVDDFVGEDWIEWDSVLSFIGVDNMQAFFQMPTVHQIHTLILYYDIVNFITYNGRDELSAKDVMEILEKLK